MPFSPSLIDELNLLTHFNLNSAQEGLKIHSNAEPQVKPAGKRCNDKGLISQADGGYLTNLGLTAAEHAQALLHILK